MLEEAMTQMVHMATIVAWAIYCGIIAAGLIITAGKQKWLERLQVYAPNRILHRLTLCNFCMGFWIAMVMTAIFYSAHETTPLIFISPFGAAAITRRLI